MQSLGHVEGRLSDSILVLKEQSTKFWRQNITLEPGAQWRVPLTPELGSQRHEDQYEFLATLVDIVSSRPTGAM